MDTHVWIWSQEEPRRLGPKTQKLLTNPREDRYVSTASTLELARLTLGGRLRFAGSPARWVSDSLELLQCGTVEVSHAVALGAYTLPGAFHRDPIDRLLVSTARYHHLTLLTADERILKYPEVASRDARR